MSTESFRTNVLLHSEHSDCQVAVIENTVLAGWEGPPLHHHGFDEAFYVLDGELTFQLGDELFTRRRGELALAPRGANHALINLSETEARYLLVYTPAGVAPPPEASKPIPETIVVGPHIGERN